MHRGQQGAHVSLFFVVHGPRLLCEGKGKEKEREEKGILTQPRWGDQAVTFNLASCFAFAASNSAASCCAFSPNCLERQDRIDFTLHR
jgi:hypothetical protein